MKKDYKLRLEEMKKAIINDKSTSFYCFECGKSFTMLDYFHHDLAVKHGAWCKKEGKIF